MTHPNLDQDLLMFAHGDLSALAAVRIRLHLIGCPDCRRRLEAFQATSVGIARAIHAKRTSPWSPFAGWPSTAVLVIMLAATIAVLTIGAFIFHQRQAAAPPAPASAPCRADLPTDQCR
ncbi:MAG: zf-HC2 domain-containing protein [Capsulimonas sp.]|uniref:anti-sigma factor family protein n=1 Tax=Capsulimonas sp. TaxID=2494211 RepID=UPI0032675E50